jgi:triacylglycerol esterase/lipase EstA (alpha/beta hydrolase family)
MFKKIVSSIIFLYFAFSPVARAAFSVPYFNINLLQQTQGGDESFSFSFDDDAIINNHFGNISIQTNNGLGTGFFSPLVSNGTKIKITQGSPEGWAKGNFVCNSDNQNISFIYGEGFVEMFAGLYSNINCTITNTKSNTKNPVLFVPGLLGSEIKKNDDILWASVFQMVLGPDDFMDPLAFNSDLKPIDRQVYVSSVINNPRSQFDYSAGLVKEFKDQGYTQGVDVNSKLFLFPYDWRYGVSGNITATTTTVDLLKKKIDEIILQTGSNKVDVVAHSTGGLLVKKYLYDYQTDHHLGKVVMVGVPNLGAPKALKVLLQGDSFRVPGLEDSEMKKIAQNLPVSFDLAPSQKYFDLAGSYFTTIISQGLKGSKTQDLNYSETKNWLTTVQNLNSTAFEKASNLHSANFDDFDLTSTGADIYSIVGCKTPTVGKIKEYNTVSSIFTKTDGYKLEETQGDGTVPFISSDSIKTSDDKKFYAIKADHAKMPSAEGVRQKIVSIISGDSLDTGSNIISASSYSNNNSQCNLKGHWWQIFSPLDIAVTDQNGNVAKIADDGSIENDIPGVSYELMGDHKFVFVPTDDNQIYNVLLSGTGNGTFTFKDSYIDNSQTISTEVYSNIPVTTLLKGSVNLGSDNSSTLVIQSSASSTPINLSPNSVINGDKSLDLAAPISTSTLSGLMGEVGSFRSDVLVKLGANDPVLVGHEAETSGVLGVKYSLDGGEYLNYSSSTPIKVASEGVHLVKFFATDRAGNNEQENEISFVIDKIAPELQITFDPGINDIVFTATDTLPTLISGTSTQISKLKKGPKVTDSDSVVTATDSAGNVTILTLKDKDRRKNTKAEIKSLSYNGKLADITKTNLSFSWQLDKKQNLKELNQRVKSKKDFNIEASYENEKTKIQGRDGTGKINQTVTGLKILKILTDKGDFNWSF